MRALPTSASAGSLPELNERLAALSENLARGQPKTRQRVFAAHAHDTQKLRQMVSVLTHRSERPQSIPLSGNIADTGLMEEGQLYALCLQELGAQLAVHSPALSSMSGELYHGFVNLFKRMIANLDARLARERHAHGATRKMLVEAENETAAMSSQKDAMERNLLHAQHNLEDRDRQLSVMEKRAHDAHMAANRYRQQLQQQLDIVGGGGKRSSSTNGGAGGGGGKEGRSRRDDNGSSGSSSKLGSSSLSKGIADSMMGGEGDGGDAAGAAVASGSAGQDGEKKARSSRTQMVDRATEGVNERVRDVEIFLRDALEESEKTGRAAEYLRRMVGAVGQVEFAPASDGGGGRGSLDMVEKAVQTDGTGDLEVEIARRRRRRRRRAASAGGSEDGGEEAVVELPMERILRLTATNKLRLDGDSRLLPMRIAARTVLQLMVEKATRAPTDMLHIFVYDFYLQMYGVRVLAERNLTSLVLSCLEYAPSNKRLGTFCLLCGLSEREANPSREADAEMICSLYHEMHTAILEFNATFAHMPPSVQAESKLPAGDDGGPLLCPIAAARKIVRSLFSPIHSLHTETFDEMVTSIDALQTSRKGKAVVDVDAMVGLVHDKWRKGRLVLREQAGALFGATDTNTDGVISYDEFTSLVLLIHPAASEDRIWRAFRECIDLSSEADATEAAEVQGHGLAGGIASDVFVNVIEEHGLLGVTLSAEKARGAQAALEARSRHDSGTPELKSKRSPATGKQSPEPDGVALARAESHDALRVELLNHDWAENEVPTRARIADLRSRCEMLAGAAKGGAAGGFAEKAALVAELDEVDAALVRLTAMLQPDELEMNAAISVRGWETYRNLNLKLSRVVTRVDDMQAALSNTKEGKDAKAAKAAGKDPAKQKKLGAPPKP